MQEGKIHQRIVARHQQLRKKQMLFDAEDVNREIRSVMTDVFQSLKYSGEENSKEELY
ncbi:hypothetical protein MUDAN_DOGOELCO_03237 [Lactiplantibacillus mudanjiangensis]|nr:hypothetical protein MUDAN_DOGOELCO_03237 [Lactiplantibacillus mudanjiangensis]